MTAPIRWRLGVPTVLCNFAREGSILDGWIYKGHVKLEEVLHDKHSIAGIEI